MNITFLGGICMTSFTNIRQDLHLDEEVPLVRDFKRPSAFIVLAPALGFATYGLAAVGMIGYDILTKLF